MGSIAGIGYRAPRILGEAEHAHREVVRGMLSRMRHRGAAEGQCFSGPWCIFGGSEAAVEFSLGENRDIGLLFDGEIFNQKELRTTLRERGYSLPLEKKEDLVAGLYTLFGEDFLSEINGTFALAVWDGEKKRLLLARDKIGAVPLFYTETEGGVVFASEIKGVLAHPRVRAKVDLESLRQVLGIGPAKIPGSGVFQGIYEVKPGAYCVLGEKGLTERRYWDIPAMEIKDTYGEAVEKVRYLLTDAVRRQTDTSLSLCSLLSGGIDSSIVTALSQEIKKGKGECLDTYSFAFKGAEEHFVPNAFQGSLDTPFVAMMAKELGTRHTYLECEEHSLVSLLGEAMEARDLPGMADVDASLLYFSKQISPHHGLAMTGECADEVFGGYPWFYREDLLLADSFPWAKNLTPRLCFLQDSLKDKLALPEYIQSVYQKALADVPHTENETPTEHRRREVGYLSLRWFMCTLLDRMDRMGHAAGLSARVPFADYRLIEYVYNLPWEMKRKDGMEKSLLREAMGEYLPKAVRERKKSPYPKTYHPLYEETVKKELTKMLSGTASPLHYIVDKNKLTDTLTSPEGYGSPWYGQLMALPQLWAYYLQIGVWLEAYQVEICF